MQNETEANTEDRLRSEAQVASLYEAPLPLPGQTFTGQMVIPMSMERAEEINDRLCNAYFILSGIKGTLDELPNLDDVSLNEAREATRIIRERGGVPVPGNPGALRFTSVIEPTTLDRWYSEAIAMRLYHQDAQRRASGMLFFAVDLGKPFEPPASPD